MGASDNRHFMSALRRGLLVCGAVLLLLVSILIVTSTSRASSDYSPYLAPCPAWAIDSTPSEGTLGSVLSSVSAVSANEIWAAGYTIYQQVGPDTSYKNLVERWDGTAWQIISTPNPDATTNYLNAVLAFSSQDVWVSGTGGGGDKPQPFLLHWDGQQWNNATLPALDPSGNELYALAGTGPQDIWAVGSIGCNKCKTEHSLVLHYNGVDWQSVGVYAGAYADAIFGMSVLSPTEVWFAGYQVGDEVQPLTMRWDGQHIENIETIVLPGNRGILLAIKALSSSDVWAVGYSNTYKTASQKHKLLIHFDGEYWQEISSPNPSEEGAQLNAIDGSGPNDIWAVGSFIASAKPYAFILHYDGHTWSQSDNPNPGDHATLYSASVTPNGDLYASGCQSGAGGLEQTATLVERYTDNCTQPPSTAVPTASSPTNTPTLIPTVQIPGTSSRTFPETDETLNGVFLDYWQQNGGLAQQGYPISGLIGEISPLDKKPYTVQYFERAVFEYHPENQPPYEVLLSQLGRFQYDQKYPDGAPNQRPSTSTDSVLFSETGKRLGGRFLQYWQQNGGLTQQGYPISDEFDEKSDLDGKIYTVQYFERGVFEYHPENQPPYDVLLSQLGTFRYKVQYGGETQAHSTPTNQPQITPTATLVVPQATATATGPCDGIPDGDPDIEFLSGRCVYRGAVVKTRVRSFDSEQIVVTVYGPDSDTLHDPSQRVYIRGQDYVDVNFGTVDKEPGIYRVTVEGVTTHRKGSTYFKVIP